MTELFRNNSPGALTREQAVELEKKRAKERARQAKALAAQGRGGDTELAHLTPGEIILPEFLQTPELLSLLHQAAAANNIPFDSLRIGSRKNRINPNAGLPEFEGSYDGFTDNGESVATIGSPYVDSGSFSSPGFDLVSGGQVDTGGGGGQPYVVPGPPTEGITVTPKSLNPPHVNAFFRSYTGPLTALANEMKVPPNFILGLAAHESAWGQSKKNNLFGLSDANEKPYSYPTNQASIDAFRGTQFFNRLQGKSNLDDFMRELGEDPNNMYNNHSGYTDLIRGAIDTVNNRLPIWEQGH